MKIIDKTTGKVVFSLMTNHSWALDEIIRKFGEENEYGEISFDDGKTWYDYEVLDMDYTESYRKVRKPVKESKRKMVRKLKEDFLDQQYQAVVEEIAEQVKDTVSGSGRHLTEDEVLEIISDSTNDYLVYPSRQFIVLEYRTDFEPRQDYNGWWEAQDELEADVRQLLGSEVFNSNYDESYRKINKPRRKSRRIKEAYSVDDFTDEEKEILARLAMQLTVAKREGVDIVGLYNWLYRRMRNNPNAQIPVEHSSAGRDREIESWFSKVDTLINKFIRNFGTTEEIADIALQLFRQRG